MSDSIKERIVKQIVECLGTISRANGYSNDIASVQRYSLNGLSLSAVPVIYVREGDDTVDRQKSARPAVARQVEVYVTVLHRPDDGDTRSGDEVLGSLCSDVERSLMADPTRARLAVWTQNPDWMEVAIEDDLPHLGKALLFMIDYRHHFQNPEQAA